MDLAVVAALEARELDAEPNGFTAEESMELLAYYLLQEDLCDAKFLWKRIPTSHKENPELVAVWEVGKTLWTKDLPGFYVTVQAFPWSERIAPVMARLKEVVQEKTLNLIAAAYTSVRPDDVAQLLGLGLPQVEEIVARQGWTVNEGLILPVEPSSQESPLTPSDDQIGKLTEFVSFLEN